MRISILCRRASCSLIGGTAGCRRSRSRPENQRSEPEAVHSRQTTLYVRSLRNWYTIVSLSSQVQPSILSAAAGMQLMTDPPVRHSHSLVGHVGSILLTPLPGVHHFESVTASQRLRSAVMSTLSKASVQRSNRTSRSLHVMARLLTQREETALQIVFVTTSSFDAGLKPTSK